MTAPRQDRTTGKVINLTEDHDLSLECWSGALILIGVVLAH